MRKPEPERSKTVEFVGWIGELPDGFRRARRRPFGDLHTESPDSSVIVLGAEAARGLVPQDAAGRLGPRKARAVVCATGLDARIAFRWVLAGFVVVAADDLPDAVERRLRCLRVSPSTNQTGQADLDYVDSVGGFVFRAYYRQDERLLRARGRKAMSFRRISKASAKSGLGPVKLWSCVAIHCLLRREPAIRDLATLKWTHLRAVLPLPTSEQFPMLREADAEHWTPKLLATRVRARLGRRPRCKRVELLAFERATRKLQRFETSHELDEDHDRAHELSVERRMEIRETLLHIAEYLAMTAHDIPLTSPGKAKRRQAKARRPKTYRMARK